jgi:periplasmic protein CpxP/Spy
MENGTRNRLTTIGLLVLLLLNVSLMVVIWYDHLAQRQPPPPREAPNPDRFVARELGLSDDQVQAFQNLRKEEVSYENSIRTEIYELQIQLINELFQNHPDSIQMTRLTEEIARKQVALDLLLLDNFTKLKQICRPDQIEKLKQLGLESFKRNKLPQPPDGNDRGERPGGPGPNPPMGH